MTSPTIILGRYKVIRELGSGGFGETFLAEDIHLPSQRICVIKKLKPIQQKPEIAQLIKERFKREAVVLEELGTHPQIPQLFAYFEEANKFYLVQEYIEGQTLEDLVRQQGIQSEDSVKQILFDCLEIIEFIQTQKIIHRDIKPENIILRAADRKPILIDFGAVREIMGTQLLTSGNSTSSIVIGTPGFMPAEQASGRPIFSSDLYALALTMIYLLTGQYPQNFPHDPLTGELDWQSQYNFSPNFVALLNRAIQTNQRERFLTASAMKMALLDQPEVSQQTAPTVAIPQVPIPETFVSGTPAKTQKILPVQFLIGLASVAAFSFVGGIGYLEWQRSQDDAKPELESVEKINVKNETASPEPETEGAIAELEAEKQALAEQQAKLAEDQAALEQAKTATPQTPVTTNANPSGSNAKNLAVVFDPPSNVRTSPNGAILCSIRDQATINVFNANGDWYQTDACGTTGVIHSSQIRRQNAPATTTTPQTSTTGVALVFDPPSNVRASPNGAILCAVTAKTHINIYGRDGEWYETDACGTMGVIHSGQLTFQN